MRIGFDAKILTVPKCGGATYLIQLLKHLPVLADDIRLFLFFPRVPLPEYADILKHERIVQVVVPGAIVLSRWPAAHMSHLLKEYRIDVFHQPFNADMPFFRAPCPTVVSIMDLIPWVVPGIFRRPYKALRYKARNILWAHCSAKVLTISESSKRDIVRFCRLSANKVLVTLLGADDIYSGVITDEEVKQVIKKFNIEGREYIVNMGGLNNFRRNPDFILEGFSRYIKDSGDDLYLIITGSVSKQDGFFERVQAKMAAEGIKDRVIITGFLSNKELKVVLSRAAVSVVSSLYEGFCLLLTESFSCGVPCIANDRGSIPEIAGNAAVLVDPEKPLDFTYRLLRLMGDKAAREALRQRGLERVKRFNWETTARQTLEAYRHIS